MSTLQPRDWLFTIDGQEDNTFILYAPLHGVALRVKSEALDDVRSYISGTADKDMPITRVLSDYGLLEFPKALTEIDFSSNEVVNHALTLSPTNKCNLRCIYCYAETGVEFDSMPWQVAKKAIDDLIAESIERGRNFFRLVFHGGGEAFVEHTLMKRCVSYSVDQAGKHNLIPDFSIVTNATLITEEIAVWMRENHFHRVTVSLDSVREAHDLQRPFVNGSGSYDCVLKGIENLKRVGIDFSIRSTVTNLSVAYMEDFIKEAAQTVFDDEGLIHFEPVSLCGRAKEGSLSVDAEEYVRNYTLAKKAGEKLGITVTCNIDKFKEDKIRYCGASNASMFCVTPNGYVSACSRITKRIDDGSELYFYGGFDSERNRFEVSESQRMEILSHGKLPEECGGCFARWNCQGGCPIARYSDVETHNSFCELSRLVLRNSIIEELGRR